ncbi:MAG: hypothetical protein GF393_11835 [Armatimonadia bacterium]|nr:hypothetical protein [Armatimonadia bacterium]
MALAGCALRLRQPTTASIHEAAALNDGMEVLLHIERGADVNAPTRPMGRTPLHVAAARGNTPLRIAVIMDQPEMAAMLRRRGGRE